MQSLCSLWAEEWLDLTYILMASPSVLYESRLGVQYEVGRVESGRPGGRSQHRCEDSDLN